MFEVMQWVQDLLEQVVDKVHREGYTPEYGAEWGCDGTYEYLRDRCNLEDNCQSVTSRYSHWTRCSDETS